jgi:hypothetical protein
MGKSKLDDSGISQEIQDARPYVRWTPDNKEPVREAYVTLENPDHRRFMLSIATKASSGWVITRTPPPGGEFIYAEIRPDVDVQTGAPTFHWHNRRTPRKHIDREFGGMKVDEKGRLHFLKGHGGEPCEEPHFHDEKAKYVFPPSPRVKILRRKDYHNHAIDYPDGKPRKRALDRIPLAEHMRKHSGSGEGWHFHLRNIKDKSGSLAKRIDMHHMAVELFDSADVVFFALEGCLKADSILTAIKRSGMSASVLSVPSVTLWRAPELDDVIEKYMQRRLVFIVPDADWAKNDLVIFQARCLQTYLEKRGIRAEVAAPPLDDKREITKDRNGKELKGVDDWLAAGHELEGMTVLVRTPPYGLEDWISEQEGYKRKDGMDRDKVVLTALALHANHEGVINVSVRSLQQLLTRWMHFTTIAKAIQSLADKNAISATPSESWYEPQKIEIVKKLRAHVTPYPLGSYPGVTDE